MIPEPYLLRPSDWPSVPAVFGVLGITSCQINPEVNQRPPWSRLILVRGSFSPVFQPRGGGVSPPNFLPLGYKFLYRLRPFCTRSAPSVRSALRPGPTPPPRWNRIPVSPAQHYHRQTPPLSESAPDALPAPQKGRSSPKRGLPREVLNED